jgi:hypothetical protein
VPTGAAAAVARAIAVAKQVVSSVPLLLCTALQDPLHHLQKVRRQQEQQQQQGHYLSAPGPGSKVLAVAPVTQSHSH